MAGVGDLLGGIGLGGVSGDGIVNTIFTIVLASFILALCGGFLWWRFKKKKNWNIKVEFRLPRGIRQNSRGEIEGSINKEWGKGYYDPGRGTVLLQRKKSKPVAMKPFDVKRFLSKENILTVIQVGIEDYRPVLEDSYLEVVDDQTGEEAALINARIDTSEGKSWKNAFERDANTTYTIKRWFMEYAPHLTMGIILFMNMVGFAILYTRIK